MKVQSLSGNADNKIPSDFTDIKYSPYKPSRFSILLKKGNLRTAEYCIFSVELIF